MKHLRGVDLGIGCDIKLPGICRGKAWYAITYRDHRSPLGPVEHGAVRLACTQCTAAMCQTFAEMFCQLPDETMVLKDVMHVTNLKLGDSL
jgi:hypothetical protein